MKQILAQSPATVAGASAARLRDEFLLTGLFQPGRITLSWWETDRAIAGGICPAGTPLVLVAGPEMRSAHFLERREAGVINIGGPGRVRVDGTEHAADRFDGLYLGRGAKQVEFVSDDAANPAKFWFLSYPAHAAYPTRRVTAKEAQGNRLGSAATSNDRTIYKYFHPGAFPTCQLVMGLTRLESGSVWNTMPPHTHLRRSEVYLYFDIPAGQAVFHFMGQPQETRHIVVRDGEAVLSPPWSVHCGAGTSNYSFIWGMGGENQEFADMDAAPITELA
jgi:4-deoxy-L-threo-5-hexosulose-uronate ketol-isomerase